MLKRIGLMLLIGFMIVTGPPFLYGVVTGNAAPDWVTGVAMFLLLIYLFAIVVYIVG